MKFSLKDESEQLQRALRVSQAVNRVRQLPTVFTANILLAAFVTAVFWDVANHTALIAFNPGGMGPNHSDVASMVLLAELLYRDAFARRLLDVPTEWAAKPGRVPILPEGAGWPASSKAWVPPAATEQLAQRLSGPLRPLARRMPAGVKGLLKGARAGVADWRAHRGATARLDLHWQPALRYRRHWPRMPAFALPSFYDGRVRINLRGREKHGLIEPSRRHQATCWPLRIVPLWTRSSASRPRKFEASRLVTCAWSGASESYEGAGIVVMIVRNSASRSSSSGRPPSAGRVSDARPALAEA